MARTKAKASSTPTAIKARFYHKYKKFRTEIKSIDVVEDEKGQQVVVVYVDEESMQKELPKRFEKRFPIRVIVSP